MTLALIVATCTAFAFAVAWLLERSRRSAVEAELANVRRRDTDALRTFYDTLKNSLAVADCDEVA